MRVVIRSRDLLVDREMRFHVKQRLREALGELGSRVGSIRVFLVGLNSPGGCILGCRTVVTVRRLGRFVVTERHYDFDGLIDRVARRAAAAVRRRLWRRRARRMRLGRSFATAATS
jgi:hypothetical protein